MRRKKSLVFLLVLIAIYGGFVSGMPWLRVRRADGRDQSRLSKMDDTKTSADLATLQKGFKTMQDYMKRIQVF